MRYLECCRFKKSIRPAFDFFTLKKSWSCNTRSAFTARCITMFTDFGNSSKSFVIKCFVGLCDVKCFLCATKWDPIFILRLSFLCIKISNVKFMWIINKAQEMILVKAGGNPNHQVHLWSSKSWFSLIGERFFKKTSQDLLMRICDHI